MPSIVDEGVNVADSRKNTPPKFWVSLIPDIDIKAKVFLFQGLRIEIDADNACLVT